MLRNLSSAAVVIGASRVKAVNVVCCKFLMMLRIRIGSILFQPIQDGSFPSMDAMETILPEYQYIFHDGKHPGQGGKHSPRGGNPGPSTSHRPK